MDLFLAMTVYVKVVETGSMTAAARALDMTQPTLSRQVDALEKEWTKRYGA